ncbi:hypothetical protein HMPREF9613_00618 [Cutibacterium acnes HL002PA1]|nr:hypothetical protein HMPREF9613_00618 [Cutibacterium acnes HL002PA1]
MPLPLRPCWIIMDTSTTTCSMQGKEYASIIKNPNLDEVDSHEYIGHCGPTCQYDRAGMAKSHQI